MFNKKNKSFISSLRGDMDFFDFSPFDYKCHRVLLSAFHPPQCRLTNCSYLSLWLTGLLLQLISKIRLCWRATGAAVKPFGRKGDEILFNCRLPILFLFLTIVITGCNLPDVPDEPNQPVEPNIVEPNEPISGKVPWTDFEAQWPIVLNGKVYIHQMRKSKTTHGVEAQFVPLNNFNNEK